MSTFLLFTYLAAGRYEHDAEREAALVRVADEEGAGRGRGRLHLLLVLLRPHPDAPLKLLDRTMLGGFQI